MKKETGVIFVLVRDNEILMQLRDGNCTKWPYHWCIPGGGNEPGEDFETTLLREVKEEYDIDLKISDCQFIMTHEVGDGISHVYLCKIADDQNPVLQEGLAMHWMSLQEIEKLELGFQQKILF